MSKLFENLCEQSDWPTWAGGLDIAGLVSRKEKKACVVGNHRIRSRGHQAFQKGHLSCLAWEQSLRTCLLQGL